MIAEPTVIAASETDPVSDAIVESPRTYKVYEYGVTQITAGLDPARAQMRARAAYWNELVDVERAYRDAIDAVISAASPELVETERQIATHKVDLETEMGEEKRIALRALLKPLYAEQKRLRKEAIATAKPELKECDTERKTKHREARQRAAAGEPVTIIRGDETRVIERLPLYWGNYLDIDAAYNTARRRFGRQLKFHSGATEDMVSVQMTNGMPVEKIWGADGRVQLDPVDERAWSKSKDIPRGERRRRSRTKGRLRVGSDGKDPIWLEFEFIMHRPLPVGSKIRRVSVVTRRVASIRQMRLLVTVETPNAPCRPEGPPYMGIDIGWRRLDGKLRVAMVVGPKDEPTRPLMLPREFIAAMQKSEEIHGGRELDFNRARANLQSWAQLQLALPDWFKAAIRYMPQWKAPGKLVHLYWQWRGKRFTGDAAAFAALKEWFEHDRHLWDWEANARDQALARRKHIFRQWAFELAKMANRHGATIAIEKFDLRGVIGAEDELDIAAHMRSLAGVGILRETIKQTAARECVPVVEVPSKNTTRLCNNCLRRGRNNLVIFDAASELNARCSEGHVWDQDANAAKNLILLANPSHTLALAVTLTANAAKKAKGP